MATNKPTARRLRGYAFDPSLGSDPETTGINLTTYEIGWDNDLKPGPVGEYVEVVDHDPLSNRFYAPVDLNDPQLLAMDGLAPSGTDPQAHQQMVYAVAMTTIENFEKALGRKVLWAPREDGMRKTPKYVQRLRIYPHALRDANAYYSPQMKALLFGYFRASEEDLTHPPGAIVFNCLSHDVVAHETTHALLDGMHRRYLEPTHPDVLAFHEAFSDIVALFQRFSLSSALRQQIAQTRGDFRKENLLAELAQEFGRATGRQGALRNALSATPAPTALQDIMEPHARGAILVAAIFEAFNTVYATRAEKLMRLATGGNGILAQSALPELLIDHLAEAAAKTARQILGICIRALDYCPPVAITFGDYLRALITADQDMEPVDELGYRVALINAFRRWGIFAPEIHDLAENSLTWPGGSELKGYDPEWLKVRLEHTPDWFRYESDRKSIYGKSIGAAVYLHNELVFHGLSEEIRKPLMEGNDRDPARRKKSLYAELLKMPKAERKKQYADLYAFGALCGMVLDPDQVKRVPGIELDEAGIPRFEVHHFRTAFRARPNGTIMDQLILSFTQKRTISLGKGKGDFQLRGGATLIIDLASLELRHCISYPIDDDGRVDEIRERMLFSLADAGVVKFQEQEPFAFLHSTLLV